MADIKKYLDSIKTAIFGKDVRKSIHDGIEAINNDCTNRLNKQDSELSQNIKKQNEIIQANKLKQDELERKYDEQIKNIASSEPQNAEIVDARAGFPTLGSIIKQKIYHFKNISEMKNCLTLVPGDVVETLGYREINDGGGATYKIRSKTSGDIEDNGKIHFVGTNLVAELIIEKEINVLSFGIDKTGNSDCSSVIQKILDESSENTNIYFPTGMYLFNSSIDFTNAYKINIRGCDNYNYMFDFSSKLLFNNCSGFINVNTCTFNDLTIIGNKNTYENDGIQGYKIKVRRCQISYFNNGFNAKGIFENNTVNRCNFGFLNLVDSRVTNNTINLNNIAGIQLNQGNNDNIIANNKIEWNLGDGINAYNNNSNIITSNIIDRNSLYGIVLRQCKNSVISNNVLKRNYASIETGIDSANLRIGTSNNITVVGNVTMVHTSQDGSGNLIPVTACYLIRSNNIVFAGNDFTGGTTNQLVKINNDDKTIYEFDLGYDVNQFLKRTYNYQWLNSNVTKTYTIENDFNMNIDNIEYKKLFFKYCRTTENEYGVCEVLLEVIKNTSSYNCKLSQSKINDNISISVSIDSNSNFVISLTNSNTTKNYLIGLIEEY